jgi:hypothetical protein
VFLLVGDRSVPASSNPADAERIALFSSLGSRPKVAKVRYIAKPTLAEACPSTGSLADRLHLHSRPAARRCRLPGGEDRTRCYHYRPLRTRNALLARFN